jgi:hypothetical protein
MQNDTPSSASGQLFYYKKESEGQGKALDKRGGQNFLDINTCSVARGHSVLYSMYFSFLPVTFPSAQPLHLQLSRALERLLFRFLKRNARPKPEWLRLLPQAGPGEEGCWGHVGKPARVQRTGVRSKFLSTGSLHRGMTAFLQSSDKER